MCLIVIHAIESNAEYVHRPVMESERREPCFDGMTIDE